MSRSLTWALPAAVTAVFGMTVLVGVPVTASPSTSSTHAAAQKAAAKQRTPMAFQAAAYGTRVNGGKIPVTSETTGFESIGCTNRAGVERTNSVASLTLPGLGTAKGVSTRNWTERHGRTLASNSTHDIAALVFKNEEFGELRVLGLTSLSRAYHTGSAFRSQTRTSIARIVYHPNDGEPQELDIPTADQPVVIPGFIVLALGSHKRSAGPGGAWATADVLDVTVVPTATRARIAHTQASINKGVTRGLFKGQSSATQARGLDDLLTSGKQPLTKMPCPGTGGKVRGKAVAAVPLGGGILVEGAATEQMGQQGARAARGYEEARIARVSIGGLVIKAITARANVTRSGAKLVRDARGTGILRATYDGETYSFDELDGLEIPGLLRIETNVQTKIRNGLDVVAVRLILLDGTGAVVDLGNAQLAIRSARRR